MKMTSIMSPKEQSAKCWYMPIFEMKEVEKLKQNSAVKNRLWFELSWFMFSNILKMNLMR